MTLRNSCGSVLAVLTAVAMSGGCTPELDDDLQASLEAPEQEDLIDPDQVSSGQFELSGAQTFSLVSSFNGTAIAKDRFIWFNSSFSASNVPSNQVSHLYFYSSTITFSANGVDYTLRPPNAEVIFDPAVVTPSTLFNAATQTWQTTVPASFTGTAFLNGLSWKVPVALPGNISPITWSTTTLTTDAPGMGLTWSWGAAVYTAFPAPVCTPKTCGEVGVNCGSVSDGCGGSLSCGTCTAPNVCGGTNVPNVCGIPPPSCTGLCTRQVTCNPGVTSISGTVVAATDPASVFGPQVDPIPRAIVYVPNGTVQPFTSGISCDGQCSAQITGSPLVLTDADFDGTFVLQNVPVGANIPLVIQIGKWRRQLTIPYVAPCVNNVLPTTLTRLPRTKLEGDIPKIAVVTGEVDTLECVLLKMGIDKSEFTVPSGTGRVHLYRANGQTLTNIPDDSVLVGSGGTLNNYDWALFDCEGSHNDKPTADKNRLISYANLGGRVFATHYSYTYLYNISPFSSTGTWQVGQNPPPAPMAGYVDTTFPKGVLFDKWLSLVGAQPSAGRVNIDVPRHDFNTVNASYAQRWIYNTTYNSVQHYTFPTPVGSTGSQQCGRVVFSDFHVNNLQSTNSVAFPKACTNTPMDATDRILEYMLFDLGACVQPDGSALVTPPGCTRQFACNLNECGTINDGCGGTIACGSCSPVNPYAALNVNPSFGQNGTDPSGTPESFETKVIAGGTGAGGTNYTGTQTSATVVPAGQTGCANVVCPAADQCHVQGVCSPATGTCSPLTNKANGSVCGDNSLCTQTDTCQAGVCVGSNPVVCSASDQCHSIGTCTPATGVCTNPALANNASCTDSNPCTIGDTCQTGACVSGAAMTCSVSDQCHTLGVCQNVAGVGTCSNPIKANGTTCADTNACSSTDVCTNGTCAGTAYTCAAPNSCQNAGTCNGNGTCSYTNKTNGTVCNDGNSCSSTDVCTNGTCGGAAYVCASPNQCQNAGSCNGDGTCSFVNRANGTVCNDGSACTQNDVCTAGACGGTTYACAAANQCQNAGSCNGDGTCSYTNKVNATICNDGTACTRNDVCTAGACGGVAFTCAPAGQCQNAGSCNGDGTCSFANRVNGTACNDGVACTSPDVCTAGNCAGAAYSCAAPNQCQNPGACNGDGTCGFVNKANGTTCNDAVGCTRNDVCTAGACGGAAYTCSAPDQCHNNGVCAGDGTCSFANRANGTSCDAGCSAGMDTCSSGICGGTCAAPDQCHEAGVCLPGGGCSFANKASGTACNDGSNSTANDVCGSGVCAGTPYTCTAPDACHQPGVPIGDFTCTFANRANGTTCTDGNACTTTDVCTAGVCGGTAATCTASDQCHAAGVCNPATGVCTNPNRANGTLCSDSNLCTTSDVCASGICGGTSVSCTASDQCHTAGVCISATGVCSNPAKGDGTTCNDGMLCTNNDVCKTGSCAGKAIVCTASDQCHAIGTCDGTTGVCSNPNSANGTVCNDASQCTAGDVCQGGSCQPGVATVCTASDQCHVAGVCSAGTGLCSNPNATNGTGCTDGSACTLSDSCQTGVCQSGAGVVCTASNQCHVAGACNPASGTCSNPSAGNGVACNDGNLCSVGDVCQGGNCTGGAAVTCSAPSQCYVAGACNPGTGFCSAATTKVNGTACTDTNGCTVGDVCQAGSCVSGPPVVCNSAAQCEATGTCNPATGICSEPTQPDGTTCADFDACTRTDVCQSGGCVGMNPVVCQAPSSTCQRVGTCDWMTGICSPITNTPNGTACSDGALCTTADSCQTGACVGTPVLCPPVNGVSGICNPLSGVCFYDN